MVIISKWCIVVCFTAKLIATSGTDDDLPSAENTYIKIYLQSIKPLLQKLPNYHNQ